MLSIHLANIKSSGVYRFVFDKSEISSQQASIMRLVVGYSEKGPFNTVVMVKNEREFKEIFGGISKKLERYGCFFHRLALQCLAKGPILCLNLKNFNNDSTKGEKVQGITIDPILNKAIGDPESILVEKIYDTSRLWITSPEVLPEAFGTNKSKYINIVTTDTKKNSCTVYMRPSTVSGYDVTLRDWYNNYQSGEYPDYVENNLDSMVSDYMVDVYIFRGQFTPEIAKSDTFTNYFVVDDKDVYVKDYVDNAFGEHKDALEALSNVDGSGFIVKYTGILLPNFKSIDGSWMSIDLLVNNGIDTHNIMMYLDESMLESGKDANNANFTLDNIFLGGYNRDFTDDDNKTRMLTDNNSAYMYNVWKVGDDSKVAIDENDSKNDFTYGDVAIDKFMLSMSNDVFTANDKTITAPLETPIYVGDKFVTKDTNGKYKLVTVLDASVQSTGEDENKKKQYIITLSDAISPFSTDGSGFIVRYNSKLTAHAGTFGTDNKFDNAAHKGVYLQGYEYQAVKPKSSSSKDKCDWINAKLSVLNSSKGIREALTNCTDTDYHYIVDTFEGFIESELRATLSQLAQDKGNAFVISNCPFMRTFAKDDSFTDKNGFNTKYIAAGRNRTKSSTSVFGLPSDSHGAARIAFFTALKYDDGGLKINVPSAGMVSNNFMDKYTSRFPYSVVAGPSYGRMYESTLIGPDYNFTREDLDNLEVMGINCMVFKPQRGTFINSNQTAKQVPVSGLSKINVVELVIYLQDTIADMLQGYQWELNTAALRANVKAKADAICETIKSNGGLYEYSNVCDETNNTSEVIDNEMIVLSTGIEPARGAGKMVHELTIYRTGGMSSILK